MSERCWRWVTSASQFSKREVGALLDSPAEIAAENECPYCICCIDDGDDYCAGLDASDEDCAAARVPPLTFRIWEAA